MKIQFLLNILLSTLLFNIAYLWPDYFGFAVLLFWIPIFFIIENLLNYKRAFLTGFLWGMVTYSIHFIWFFILLRTKAYTTLLSAFYIYFFIVSIFAITSGVCFLILFFIKRLFKRIILKIFMFLFVWWFYFLFLSDYFFKILNKNIKYPFILPTVPLASFKIFLKFLAFLYFPLNNPNQISVDKFKALNEQIFYIQPGADLAYKYSHEIAIDKIYCNILNIKREKSLNKEDKATFFLMPESAFPFVLNNYNFDELKLKKALSDKDNLLLGGFHEKNGKFFQSIYLIRKGRITQIYDKTILVPGAEKLPKFWRKYFPFIEKLFLKDKRILSKGKFSNCYFELIDDFKIVPKVCSEFFWQSDASFECTNTTGPKVIFAFINDSWFCSYFRKLMQNYAQIRVVKSGISVVYIGFEGIEFFD